MIYRIRDTTTAWQIAKMCEDFGYISAFETISIFTYVTGRGPEGLYIELPHEPKEDFKNQYYDKVLTEID